MWPFHFVLLLLVSSSVAGRGGFGGGRGYGGSRTGSGSHTYPHSTGYSGTGRGSHNYPPSGGYSGNNRQNYGSHNQPHGTYYTRKTEVHNHYHYSPPQHISYGGVSSHPVYSAPPPVYVYQYRDSGSRFDNLLAGLALYNLGRMSATSSNYRYDSSREYKSRPGEICKLGISKQNGEYEETRIDCKLMSSFILESQTNPNQQVETKTITTVNVQHGVNGDTTTTTVTDALQVKGPSIKVTPGMNCFMIRISSDTSVLKKNVECGLLQAYAVNSLHYSSSERLVPSLTIVVPFLMFVMYFTRI